MKYKFTSIIVLGLIAMGFTSCMKEYNCKCVMTYSGAPGFEPTEKEYKIKNTKNKAQTSCEAQSAVYVEFGIVTKEDCNLF